MDSSLAGSFVHGIPRQEYWSGLPFPSPGDLPNPRINSGSPALQGDSLPSEPLGKPYADGGGASFPQAPSFQCRRISMRTKLVFCSNLWWDILGYFIPSSPQVLQSEWWLWKEKFWVCSLVISFSMAFPTESPHDLPFQTLPYWRSLLPSPLPVTVKFGNPVLGSSWLVNT